MTDNVGTSVGQSVPLRDAQYRRRLIKAIALKEYAINRRLNVPEEIIRKLNKAAAAAEAHSVEAADDVDIAIRDLTAITYPTTIDSIDDTEAQSDWFFGTLLAITVAVLLVAMYASSFNGAPGLRSYCASLVAAALGFLGSAVYIFFNLIGVMEEKAFSRNEIFPIVIRMSLGAILGWVFYLTMPPDAAKFITGGDSHLILLLPFLAGFSTRLVVGLINQAIRAIEITLNLDDKATALARRQADTELPARKSGS